MNRTVVTILDQMFATRRDQPALIAGDEIMTYGDLDAATARVAANLVRHGVPPRSIVGLTGERSLTQVVCVVGIVRAGHAFCYLDHKNPPAWNRDVIGRTALRHVVGSDDMGADLIRIDIDDVLAPAERADVMAPGPDDPVYVNFSSGTTGAPKIIPCTHRGVVGFCHAPQHFPAGPESRFIYSSPLTFDASMFEIWCALLNGGSLVINLEPYLSAEILRQLIARHRANSLWLTTSLFNALMDVDPGCLDGIRILVTGGEELSPKHIETLYRANPTITAFNGYGPTENTMITTMYEIPRDHDFREKIPIGYAVHDSYLVVLAEDGRRCDDGEVGELVMAGNGLSPGYIGDPGLTAEKFRTLEIDGQPTRCYWSGDLVSRSPSGLFHYHGRKDDQIKIRGNRVTLTDIAYAFSGHPGIRDCAAVLAGGSIILLFTATGDDVDAAVLAEYARARVPDFMVPRDFVRVDALPLKSNGKVDRAQLVAQLEARSAAARSGHEGSDADLGAYLRGLTGLDRWEPDESFFASGGDSLGAIKIVGAINRLLGADRLGLGELYRAPTLRHLLELVPAEVFLNRRAVLGREADQVVAPADMPRQVPLTPMQLSMVYPELLHGDTTMNNVVYLFQEHVRPAAGVSLADVHAALLRRFPLLGATVIDGDEGFAFDLSGDRAPAGLLDEIFEFVDMERCGAHFLAMPLSLFEGPLLALFRCRVAGRLHHGVLLHHILGDHIGQTEILREIVARMQGAEHAAAAPDHSFVAANQRLCRRYQTEQDACAAFWATRDLVVSDLPDELATTASQTVLQRRTGGARPDRTPSEQMLVALAATRAGLQEVFGVAEPAVYCLFSLREHATGLGFQTCLAPVLLRDALFPDGRPSPALLDELLAIRKHCVIGMEEILIATGIGSGQIPFLFNFVELRPEDHAWWSEHLVNMPSESCKTALDVTVIRTGQIFDITVNTRFEAARAEALLAILVSHLARHAD